MGTVFLLEWTMANADNISGALHVTVLTGTVLFWNVNLESKKIQLYFFNMEQPNTHTQILSLSLFHPHAGIILNG